MQRNADIVVFDLFNGTAICQTDPKTKQISKPGAGTIAHGSEGRRAALAYFLRRSDGFSFVRSEDLGRKIMNHRLP